MTLQASGHNFWPLRLVTENSATISLGRSNPTFDSATDRLAYVGVSPISDTISKVYFRTSTVTTGNTMLIQIESVLNGRPNGIIAAGASGTVVIADTDDNVWKTVTIGTPPSITAGQEFAIVMTNSSGTPSMLLGGTVGDSGYSSYSPTSMQDTGAGTWTLLTGLAWIVEMGTAGVISLPNLTPIENNGTITAFNNTSAPNEYALKFVMPFTCRCIGVSACLFNVAAAGNFTLSLWPASSSVDGDALGQKAMDGDLFFTTTADGYVIVFFTGVTLTAGTTYYIGLRADTANNIGHGHVVTPSGITNSMKGFPIVGTVHQATRTWTAGTAGAWTNAANNLPFMSILYDQLDDGTGGSGGGMRLAGSGGLASGA